MICQFQMYVLGNYELQKLVLSTDVHLFYA